MLVLVLTGHVASCSAPLGGCCSKGCEGSLYLFTGILALVAGIVEGSVALWIALSVFAFSDAVHAVADAATDFYSRFIAQRAGAQQTYAQARAVRRSGRYVVVVFLVAATVPIIIGLLRHEGHPAPVAMMAAGAIAVGINFARLRMLRAAQRAQATPTRDDLIRHARADVLHSIYVIAAGLLFLLGEHYEGGLYAVYIPPLDKLFAGGVVLYILYQAWKVWEGKAHDHPHHHSKEEPHH